MKNETKQNIIILENLAKNKESNNLCIVEKVNKSFKMTTYFIELQVLEKELDFKEINIYKPLF